MRIFTKRRISFFCSLFIVRAVCRGGITPGPVGMARAVAMERAPGCAEACLANSRVKVMITTFERDVAISVNAVRAVRQVSLFGVKMPLRTLKRTRKNSFPMINDAGEKHVS